MDAPGSVAEPRRKSNASKLRPKRPAGSGPPASPAVEAVAFGRDVCGDPESASAREWLVTNGIGGYASGTVGGIPTRRYHGLLVAAVQPPVGRRLLAVRLGERLRGPGFEVSLDAVRWASGTVAPDGFRHLESFRLDGVVPVWTYAIGAVQVEKRVWMARGSNTTYVEYRLPEGSGPASLGLDVFAADRDHHGAAPGTDATFRIEPVPGGLRVQGSDVPLPVLAPGPQVMPRHTWYRNHDLARERDRGFDGVDDDLLAASLEVTLPPGGVFTLTLSTEPDPPHPGASLETLRAHEADLLARADGETPVPAPAWIRRLALAADQFVVMRSGTAPGSTVLAGYPWFGDWGRDTMIALPGLALATGRPEVAAHVLRTFAPFVSRGMLPNFFPEAGAQPEYNTVDAALWYFEAVRQTYRATRDRSLLEDLLPALTEIVEWHLRGTRFGIQVDPGDGLLRAGEAGWQLTWMDARADGREITPRIGKPVEVNALWINALASLIYIHRELGRSPNGFDARLSAAKTGFARFWNPDRGYCFDVIDGPDGDDPTLRPNQIFAVSLPVTALPKDRLRGVVDACAHELLTSHGLRSLAAAEPGYAGRYQGGASARDAVYHQGPVWGWLLGPFALAHWRVYGDPAAAARFLEPMRFHLQNHGLGTLSEIFDGDAPHRPRGCFAQAWTVGEILRAWCDLHGPGTEAPPVRAPGPAGR